nr:MAG TPA: hypothetical protein [Caudoviricetes sp.]
MYRTTDHSPSPELPQTVFFSPSPLSSPIFLSNSCESPL